MKLVEQGKRQVEVLELLVVRRQAVGQEAKAYRQGAMRRWPPLRRGRCAGE